jgi:hypothetical protein
MHAEYCLEKPLDICGKTWVQFPKRSLEFFNLRNPSCCSMALEYTQSLTKMSSRDFLGDLRAAGV